MSKSLTLAKFEIGIHKLRELDTSQVTLLVDSHEPEYIRSILLGPACAHLDIQQTELKVGDYWFVYKGILLFVFERKTLSDMNNALHARHGGQFWYMCQLPLPRENMQYILELEDESKIPLFQGMPMILSELEDMLTQSGIAHITTQDVEETLFILMTRLKTCAKRGEHLLQELDPERIEDLKMPIEVDLEVKEEKDEGKRQDYPLFVKPTPRHRRIFGPMNKWKYFKQVNQMAKDNPYDLYLNMLRCIQGMGSKAESIAKMYPSLSDLEELRKKEGDEQGALILAEIKSGGRRIGPVLARKVMYALKTEFPPMLIQTKKKKRKRPTTRKEKIELD